MPIRIRLMSWNIQGKQTNAAYIAALMQAHRIDICALLEVPTGSNTRIPTQIIAQLNNLAPAYHQHEWHFVSVVVGDESVSYIWHQNATVGPNAFIADTYANDAARPIAGQVMTNALNAPVYFPTTHYRWTYIGTPGSKPTGRRPAFMSFLTNDHPPARRFTFLDLHTPFNNDNHTLAYSIQSYATHIYASSREISAVETISVIAGIGAAVATFHGSPSAMLSTYLGPYATFLQPLAAWNGAVAAADRAIRDSVAAQGSALPALFQAAAIAGTRGAHKAISAIPSGFTSNDARALAIACAMAGTGAAAALIASLQLPTHPPAATTPTAARTAAESGVMAQIPMYYHRPGASPAEIRGKILAEANRMAVAVAATFTFPNLPQALVDGAVIAGDFNVHYPDTTAYSAAAQAALAGTNAYHALETLSAATGGVRNTAASTCIGASAFESQRVYTLRNPCPIQHTNAALPTYVPLDMTPLIVTPVSFIGNEAWQAGLQRMAQTQGLSWAQITAPPYADRLSAAFAMEVINDTSFYRANCYDNIFVRGATVGPSGLLDVLSELGSWLIRPAAVHNPQPVFAPNPWPAAARSLNPLAQTELTRWGPPFQFLSYTITPAIQDAEEAAVVFRQFISDHLPVFVEIQI